MDQLVPFSGQRSPPWAAIPPCTSDFIKIPLQRSHATFVKTAEEFHKTLSEEKAIITEIYQIKNYFLWQKYQCQKKFMCKGRSDEEISQLERNLFHGTEEDALDSICQMNFDHRVAGKNGTVYGQGSYFARDARYSHGYTWLTPQGHRYMFLAKVLTGKPAQGRREYRRPPPLKKNSPNSSLYDLCVDNVSDPKIFVIFDSCQCYPYYLIKYRFLDDDINID
ncbi:protein mono-ADP-ribosyltransferase TIPARP-like [Latimeria chalumnae]|uniref:protein mono-ADP-ribosyltransferase TIPARP-like n=1 Tax=Latimeria chalumnae TaxID=7897 RepID=UPI00313B447F